METIVLLAVRQWESTFWSPVSDFQTRTWNKIENLDYPKHVGCQSKGEMTRPGARKDTRSTSSLMYVATAIPLGYND